MLLDKTTNNGIEGQNKQTEWKQGDVILDLYEVQDAYTGGAMGLVYKVFHRSWRSHLAVKSPREEHFQNRTQIDNFMRECETWINLGLHPNIVSCYYVREIDGKPRVFCEFIDGGSLQDWINDKRLYRGGNDRALKRIIDIAIQFAWALHYAHEKNLVHQDVKPSNVMMRLDGTPLINDFGLANTKSANLSTIRANAGQSVAVTSGGYTPAYCSPEQASGEPVTRRTDIWSWAVSILEMFTGDLYWMDGRVAEEVLDNLLSSGTHVSEAPELPASLGKLLKQCFIRNIQDRPKNMLEIADSLLLIYKEATGIQYPRLFPKTAESDAASLNNRAISFIDMGKDDHAENLFQEALRKHPGHLETTYNYGLWQWQKGNSYDRKLLNKLVACGESKREPGQMEMCIAQVHMARLDISFANSSLQQAKEKGFPRTELDSAFEQVKALKQYSAQTVRSFQVHDGNIPALCLSPGDHIAISGNREGKLMLWDIGTGTCIRTLEGQPSPIKSVSISPDCKQALSGTEDCTIQIWDLSSGDCLHTIKRLPSTVSSVCYSKDGKYALVGSHIVVMLWDLTSKECIHVYEGHGSYVNAVCFSHDGTIVLSGSKDKTIKLWDRNSEKCIHTLEGHTSEVNSVCFSPDGKLILSASADKTLKLWDRNSGICLRTFSGHAARIQSADFSPNGQFIISGSSDWMMKLWDVNSTYCYRTFEGHAGGISYVRFSSNGRFVLSGASDGLIKLWDINGFYNDLGNYRLFIVCKALTVELSLRLNEQLENAISEVQSLISLENYPAALKLFHYAHTLPGGDRNADLLALKRELPNSCTKIAIADAWESCSFEGHTDNVNAVCFSPDGKFAISGSEDKTIILWDVTTGKCLNKFTEHKSSINTLCFSPDGKELISGAGDILSIWNLNSGLCISSYLCDSTRINSISLSKDGKHVVTGDSELTVKLRELTSGNCIRILKGHKGVVSSVCFSPDEKYILSGSWDNSIILWKIASGKSVRSFTGHSNRVFAVCFSPDGKWVLSGSSDKTVKLWNSSNGKCFRTFLGLSHDVVSVCFSPDGRWILAGCWDATIKLWEISSGICVYTFEGHMDSVNSLSFAPDGWRFISGSSDKTIKLWELNWDIGMNSSTATNLKSDSPNPFAGLFKRSKKKDNSAEDIEPNSDLKPLNPVFRKLNDKNNSHNNEDARVFNPMNPIPRQPPKEKKPISFEGIAKIMPNNPIFGKPHGSIGRNDPCPCGSGKKYKKCCGSFPGQFD